MDEEGLAKLAEAIRTAHIRSWGEPQAQDKLDRSPWDKLPLHRKQKWLDIAETAFYHLKDAGWMDG